ncbi:MAG TPA: hypothetical protein VFN87_02385 [Solirubrobacteraceae bacterium]|nr:hypothetical protein [Solirubrobacteraceae bacterium]
MTALRRDLIERKLWLLVAVLVAAIAAVPVLLSGGGSTATAHVPLPPPVVPTSTQPAAHAKAVPVKDHISSSSRDPFGNASTTSSTTTSASAASHPASSGTSSATPAASATSAPSASSPTAAMVTPTPTSTPASTVTNSGASSTTHTSTHTTTSSPQSSPSQPVSTTASVTPKVPAKVQSWTTYSVWVRAGKDSSVPVREDLARLTPLPSPALPEAMFMGVMAGGREAVFALRQGVAHSGPGVCRPGRAQCSVILLKPGQTEKLTVPANGGKTWQFILRVVHIASRVTHSEKQARAAFTRHSAAGLCDLAMADPLGYNMTSGTLLTIASAVCTGQKNRVPFPSTASIAPAAPAGAATTATPGSGS